MKIKKGALFNISRAFSLIMGYSFFRVWEKVQDRFGDTIGLNPLYWPKDYWIEFFLSFVPAFLLFSLAFGEIPIVEEKEDGSEKENEDN